jgi:predicted nucleic acid-binding protein
VVKALFDTNILLDFLKGSEAAHRELSLYSDRAISIVTRMEVLVGADVANEAALKSFLGKFAVVNLEDDIADRAVVLRRTHRLKLVDAIVWASAQVTQRLLVTRDVKDFPKDDPGIRVPYKL